MFDNLQVEEVVLVFSSQHGVPASGFRHFKLLMGVEVVGWGKRENLCLMRN